MRGFFWVPLGVVAGAGIAVVANVMIGHHRPFAWRSFVVLCLWLTVAGMIGRSVRRILWDGADGQEAVVIALLLIGGLILPLFGWLLGVYLLWRSPVWTVKDKLTGTLVIPGGLMMPIAGAALAIPGGSGSCFQTSASVSAVCTSSGASPFLAGSFITIMALLTIAPIFSAIWLYKRMRPVVNPLNLTGLVKADNHRVSKVEWE